jgi:hypothetical protein
LVASFWLMLPCAAMSLICFSTKGVRTLRAAEVSQRTILAAPQKGPPDRGIDVVSFLIAPGRKVVVSQN